MDHRMEHRGHQKFLALVRTFSEENKRDDGGRSIPEFWTECYENDLIEPMKRLRREGDVYVYGLCRSLEERKRYFHYAIGVLLAEDADEAQLERFLAGGYSLWETEPSDYAVFQCIGPDEKCLHEIWSKFFGEFSPATGYRHTGDTDFERYPEPEEDGLFCELWIPVKKN